MCNDCQIWTKHYSKLLKLNSSSSLWVTFHRLGHWETESSIAQIKPCTMRCLHSQGVYFVGFHCLILVHNSPFSFHGYYWSLYSFVYFRYLFILEPLVYYITISNSQLQILLVTQLFLPSLELEFLRFLLVIQHEIWVQILRGQVLRSLICTVHWRCLSILGYPGSSLSSLLGTIGFL